MRIVDHGIQALIDCEKLVEDSLKNYIAPSPGEKREINLVSPEMPRERFILTLRECRRSSTVILGAVAGRKVSMQTRDSSVPLVRVDVGEETSHTNPDGIIVRGSHVHVASWEYGMRMAYPFSSAEAIMVTGGHATVEDIFESFRAFCHIDRSLSLQWTFGI